MMIEKVLQPKNLYKAYRKVVGNKGAPGVDDMKVGDLRLYLGGHRTHIITSILNKTYVPQAIRGAAAAL
ncbi:hypothetical protein PZB74_22255 [Porifericola rhodea]|uniref:hypothetical protein n=1 Tax=Porifericola rhodea TaxID=930972 RepID=UPI0026655696|nr:hypothetical protein [Porifericola rhodea]WKN31673.1 hypothetical protein PZB74_22255 [Porifericola rhodea]